MVRWSKGYERKPGQITRNDDALVPERMAHGTNDHHGLRDERRCIQSRVGTLKQTKSELRFLIGDAGWEAARSDLEQTDSNLGIPLPEPSNGTRQNVGTYGWQGGRCHHTDRC